MADMHQVDPHEMHILDLASVDEGREGPAAARAPSSLGCRLSCEEKRSLHLARCNSALLEAWGEGEGVRGEGEKGEKKVSGSSAQEKPGEKNLGKADKV